MTRENEDDFQNKDKDNSMVGRGWGGLRIVCWVRHILTLKRLGAYWPKTCLHSQFFIGNANEQL